MVHATMMCWVCGKKLGPVVGPMNNATCSVLADPIGNEHRVHHVCIKGGDGKLVRTEPVEMDQE